MREESRKVMQDRRKSGKLYPQSYKNEWKINGNRVLVSTQISQFWDTAFTTVSLPVFQLQGSSESTDRPNDVPPRPRPSARPERGRGRGGGGGGPPCRPPWMPAPPRNPFYGHRGTRWAMRRRFGDVEFTVTLIIVAPFFRCFGHFFLDALDNYM